MMLRLKSLQMLGSDTPFSNWANQPLEIQNLLSPFTPAIRRLACSTSRTVMLRRLRIDLRSWPAGTVVLQSGGQHRVDSPSWESCEFRVRSGPEAPPHKAKPPLTLSGRECSC